MDKDDTGFRISSGLPDASKKTKLSKMERLYRQLDELATIGEETVYDDGDDNGDNGDDAFSTAAFSTTASAAASVAPSLASVATAALSGRLKVSGHAHTRSVQRDVDVNSAEFWRDIKTGHRVRTQDKSGEPSTRVVGKSYVIWLTQDGKTVKSVTKR